jgi:hypothetical protein
MELLMEHSMAASPTASMQPNNDNNVKHKGRRLYQKDEVVLNY